MLKLKVVKVMANFLEIQEKQRDRLGILLKIKKQCIINNISPELIHLQQEIIDAIRSMDQEDIAWVEKLYDIKAL